MRMKQQHASARVIDQQVVACRQRDLVALNQTLDRRKGRQGKARVAASSREAWQRAEYLRFAREHDRQQERHGLDDQAPGFCDEEEKTDRGREYCEKSLRACQEPDFPLDNECRR